MLLDTAIASPTRRRLQLERSMNDYPKLPPRLMRIFANNPVFFVTFCTHRRRQLLATKSVNAAFVEFGIRAHAEQNGQKWNYVRENPVRAGLVAQPEDWPYAGEIVRIDRV